MDEEIEVYKVCSDDGTGPRSWCTRVAVGAPGVKYKIGERTIPVASGTPLLAFRSERLARKFLNMCCGTSASARLFRASAKPYDLPVPDYIGDTPTNIIFAVAYWSTVVPLGGVPCDGVRTPEGTVLCSEITLVDELKVAL